MAVKVVTVSTCDRCGRVDEEEGDEGERPADWGTVDAEWSWNLDAPNTKVSRLLCPSCLEAVIRLLMPLPQDAPDGPGNTVEAKPGSGDALIQGTI